MGRKRIRKPQGKEAFCWAWKKGHKARGVAAQKRKDWAAAEAHRCHRPAQGASGRCRFDDNPESPHPTHDRLARQRPTFGLCRPAAGSLVSRVPFLPSLRGSEAPGGFGVLGIVYVDAATIPGAQDQLVDSVARRPILTLAVQSPTGESMDQ